MTDRRKWTLDERARDRLRRQGEGLREAFPGTHRGDALPASPTGRTARSGVPAVSVRRDAPYGEAIHVTTAQGQSFEGGGSACEWVGELAHIRRAGFADVAFPTDRLTIPTFAYWQLNVKGGWQSYTRGGTVTVLRSGTVLYQDRLPFWTGYSETFDLGICEPGETIQVVVSPVGEAGAQPDGQAATFVASLVLDELPVGAVPVQLPQIGGYWVGFQPNGNELRVRRRHDGDPSGMTALLTVPFTSSQDVWYWMRARIDGRRIRARIWSGAVGDEPSSWLVDVTDPQQSQGDSGYAGIGGPIPGFSNQNAQRRCDVFEVSHDGGSWQSTDFSEYTNDQPPSDWLQLAAVGSQRFRVRADGGATGGKTCAWDTPDEGIGEWIGWEDAGVGESTEVLARLQSKDTIMSMGVVLRGNVHGVG